MATSKSGSAASLSHNPSNDQDTAIKSPSIPEKGDVENDDTAMDEWDHHVDGQEKSEGEISDDSMNEYADREDTQEKSEGEISDDAMDQNADCVDTKGFPIDPYSMPEQNDGSLQKRARLQYKEPGKSKEDEDKAIRSSSARFGRLFPVERPRRFWYGKKWIAQFILEDGRLIPSTPSLILQFRQEGSPVDLKLKFFIGQGRDEDDTKSYQSSLIFGSKHISELRFHFDTADKKSDSKYVLLDGEIKASGCVTVGLSRNLKDDTMNSLRSHLMRLSSSNSAIKFRLRIDKTSWEDCQLRSLKFRCDYAWSYRSTTNTTILTQYGQFNSRGYVATAWSNLGHFTFKVPAVNHFYDLEEAAVKLIYGARLEYEISTLQLKRLVETTHKITLLTFENSKTLLGAVQFMEYDKDGMPDLLSNMPVVLPHGTRCELTVSFGDYGDTKQRFKGITVPNVISLNVPCDIVVLLLPPSEKWKARAYVNNWKSPYQSPEFNCGLEFKDNEESVKSQINAINTLCGQRFARWHPILLNSDYAGLRSLNFQDGLCLKDVENAYESVDKIAEWNAPQYKVFELLKDMPGNGFAFVEGIFGCGKTLIQAALAKLLAGLGMHVLIVAPTNAALKAFSAQLHEIGPELKALRYVYDGAKFSNQLDFEENSVASDVEFSMFQLLESGVAMRGLRYDVLPCHSMQSHLDELVLMYSKDGGKLSFNSQSDDPYKPIEVDDVQIYLEYKDTDFSEKLRQFRSASSKEQSKSVTDAEMVIIEKIFRFRRALKRLQQAVVSRSQILMCTNQLAASELVRKFFAGDVNGDVSTNGIVIIADEDGQAPEPTAWIPIVLLRHADHVKAVFRFGD